MEIASLYELYKQHPEVTTDTRNCPLGSIFFALRGENFNGNQYAQKAIDAGCSYAIVDDAHYATHPNIILVEDSLRVLQALANYHRKKLKTPIVAITGTNGKTTTKELVLAVLCKEYNVIATEGNYNNHIGVPLTLLRMKKEHEIAVVEMGANHVGEIRFLAEIAEPNYGLITNIGHAHLEGFGSYENIIKTKGELYEYIRTTQEGKVFADYDNELLRAMANGLTTIFYGLEEDLFISGKVIRSNPYLEFEWKFVNSRRQIKTKMVGEYNLPNALAAITIGKYLGVKTDLICKAIEEYDPVNSRSQLKDTERNMLIIDAYNANPTSMHAALENFDHMQVSSKALILGDMKELGPDSDMEHQKIADYVGQHRFNKVFFVGENFSKVKTSYPRFKNLSDFREHLKANPIVDSYVLVKGSRGIQLEKCIDML